MTDSPSNPLDDATLATIDRWLSYRVWHSRVPGAQVAIGVGGEPVFSRAYGYADLERREAMRTDHLFRIASHSKTFTATAVLQLVERGRLKLDDRVGDHLADLAGQDVGDIMIRELLEHAGGVLRDGEDADYWLGSRPFPDQQEMITLVRAGLKRQPGELFAYSNLGYGLLGAMITAVTGQPYAEATRQLITEPLALADTDATYRQDRAADYARGYTGLATGLRREPIDHVDTRALDAAAGFTSTAMDLVRYFSAHAIGDTRLLSDRSKRLMQRTANITDPAKSDGPTYGLGMAGESFDDHRTVGHGGGYPGHITRTLLDPETGLVISALTNAIDGPAGQLAAGILKIVDDAREHPAANAFDGEVVTRLGRYHNVWGVLDVGIVGGRMLAMGQAGWDPLDGADVLEVVGPRRFMIASGSGYGSVGETVTFADGSMRYGSMTMERLDDLPEREDLHT